MFESLSNDCSIFEQQIKRVAEIYQKDFDCSRNHLNDY
jgi:hypothetical protein